jgi:hypothetical protein
LPRSGSSSAAELVAYDPEGEYGDVAMGDEGAFEDSSELAEGTNGRAERGSLFSTINSIV